MLWPAGSRSDGCSPLAGASEDAVARDDGSFLSWLGDVLDDDVRAEFRCGDVMAVDFWRIRSESANERKEAEMKLMKKPDRLKLPVNRSEPVDDWQQYAYLITGEKKIGKTKFSIEGCEELVLQFDKPQLAYSIREIIIKSWADFRDVLLQLEAKAEAGEFAYGRIVVDGAGEWYQMCQTATCKKFGVDHPSEEGYARAWHHLRDNFTDAVNRLLRLQRSVGCGLVFIAHAEWKEKNTRGGLKVDRLVPNLPPKCEEILNGKCDAWFTMDYDGKDRIMVLLGDETTGAGHRIDGHFMTPDGRRIEEVHMGSSSEDALRNFSAAFNNTWKWATNKEREEAASEPTVRSAIKRKAIVRKK